MWKPEGTSMSSSIISALLSWTGSLSELEIHIWTRSGGQEFLAHACHSRSAGVSGTQDHAQLLRRVLSTEDVNSDSQAHTTPTELALQLQILLAYWNFLQKQGLRTLTTQKAEDCKFKTYLGNSAWPCQKGSQPMGMGMGLFKSHRRDSEKPKASCLPVLSVFAEQELRDATRRGRVQKVIYFTFREQNLGSGARPIQVWSLVPVVSCLPLGKSFSLSDP